MIKPIQTFSEPWLLRHRETHHRHPEFGTHRHPYLLDTIRRVATDHAGLSADLPSLLDYGCGKGAFMREMTATGLFRFIRGYDPAIDRFSQRPTQRYDVVLCLDVLDQLEPDYVRPAIADVTQFTGRVAIFSLITRQVPRLAHLNPRGSAEWQALIGETMTVAEAGTRVAPPEELAEGACPERAIIVAMPTGRG